MGLFFTNKDEYGIIEEDREAHPDTSVEMLIQIRDLLRTTNTLLHWLAVITGMIVAVLILHFSS